MSNKKQVNRLIVTDKGLEISKDIKKEIEQNQFSHHQWEDSPKKNMRSLTPANPNLPSGYNASLQARKSVQIMNMPVKSLFVTNSRYHSPQINPITSNNNFSTHFGSLGFNQNHHDQLSPFSNFNHYYTEGQPRSSLLAKSNESLNPILNSSNNKLHLSTAKIAVNNKKALQNLVSVESLGGLKLPLNNLNYQKEMLNQNEMQKQSIQQVQQERLLKKYNEWNEQYLKSNELMKTKYYQKYEDISKLGNKEDEENFWRQWHEVKQSFDQCLQNAEEQNHRYEERLVRKLNKKYRSSFKVLPNVAKIPKSQSTQNFPQIPKRQQSQLTNQQ